MKVGGKVTYLGAYGSDASRSAYAEVVTAVLSGREVVFASRDRVAATVVTVRDVCERFKPYARGSNVKDGKPSAEAGIACRSAQ